MPDLEFDPFYLDPDYIKRVVAQLEKTGFKADSSMAQFLRDYTNRTSGHPPLALLGMAAASAGLVRSVGMDSVERRAARSPIGPADWGRMFIEKLLKELRDIFCGKGKTAKPLGGPAQAAIAAIAAYIMQQFHVSQPSATGLAVLVLLALARAAKKSLCEMTDNEILEALRKSSALPD